MFLGVCCLNSYVTISHIISKLWWTWTGKYLVFTRRFSKNAAFRFLFFFFFFFQCRLFVTSAMTCNENWWEPELFQSIEYLRVSLELWYTYIHTCTYKVPRYTRPSTLPKLDDYSAQWHDDHATIHLWHSMVSNGPNVMATWQEYNDSFSRFIPGLSPLAPYAI